MGIFGIYFLICTCLLMVYYVVTIWFDVRGNKGRKKDDSEVISTDGIIDTESSTDVRELDGGGYHLSSSVDEDDDDFNAEEHPVIVLGDDEGGQEQDGVHVEQPSTDGGDNDPDDAHEPDPEPSQFERAKQIHDEEMNAVEKIYQEQLNCRELVAQMACPLSQKTRIYRRRLVY